MKKVLLALLLFSISPVFGQQKKCLLVLLDGIPADVLEKTATPNIDAVAKKGAYARAYVGGEKGGASESPTISAVGYNSMLTGTWANKHNVWGNAIKKPNYAYPTIFKAARDSNPETSLGIYSTWEDNRTKLLGEGLPETNKLSLNYIFDGYELDTLTFPHDEQREYIKNIDNLVVAEAAKSIKKDAPDLSWVYLEYTDDIGHKFGDSPEMTAAVKLADQQIGQLYAAIKEREKKHKEEWLLIITTDHGRSPENGKGHGGQSDRERTTWLVSNQSNVNERFRNGLAIVDIFPTVAQFLKIQLDKSIAEQLDGVSFLE
ncbi:alkaline phosphatase family protein [Arcticibacterium luteifluviistationis]|uniref:Nucleotide pyrophosphatase n=1 Tax=Arcticibacterium luteifluviistationis TaxID=1784714 RepID=A0A2Z4GC53_9BACT|nr:alkaline phosphatase family protein [Arcticibacterium luteifluviistationis]AWV98879.1 nucleotide pyrophosphatase [Arcticibacterium luteifluviistationis]